MEDVTPIYVLFQVQRALILWPSGTTTIQLVRDAQDSQEAINKASIPTSVDSAHFYAFSRDNWKTVTDWYLEQVTNLREREFDTIVDQAQNYTKSDLPVLVRPPEERGDDIPESLCSDSSSPTALAGSATPVRVGESGENEGDGRSLRRTVTVTVQTGYLNTT